jgi:hypothetical protein
MLVVLTVSVARGARGVVDVSTSGRSSSYGDREASLDDSIDAGVLMIVLVAIARVVVKGSAGGDVGSGKDMAVGAVLLSVSAQRSPSLS